MLAVVLATWLYTGPARHVPGVYNSPDEAATAVYAQQFARTGDLALMHPFDAGTENEFLHPRSSFADFGAYSLPVGFWGLPVFYGSIINAVGVWALPFLTPLLVIVAVLAAVRLWQIIFPGISRSGLLLLSLSLPPLWYYAARPLLPNVPFVALILIGSVWLIAPPTKNGVRWWHDVMGAFSIGLGVLVRPSEALWVVIAALIVLVAYRQQIAWSRVARWGVVAVVIGAMYFGLTTLWYGSAGGGYVTSRSLPVPHWWTLLLPFGFSIRNLVATGYTYAITLWPWFVWPALAWLVRGLWQWRDLSKAQKVYATITIFVGLYLWVYYGSWRDANYDLKTIGVAYTRYWLPVFILLVPFAVRAYQLVAAMIGRSQAKITFAIILGLLVIGNANAVYSGVDGITALTHSLRMGATLRDVVRANTAPQAVIITEREDKFIWPARQVMVRFDHPRVRQAAANFVAREWPVYYVARTLSSTQLQTMNEWLEPVQLRFADSKEIVDGYTLYPIVHLDGR